MTSEAKKKPAKVLQHPAGSAIGEAFPSIDNDTAAGLPDPNPTAVSHTLDSQSPNDTKSDDGKALGRVRDFAGWAVLNPTGLALIEGRVLYSCERGQRVSTRDIIGITREARGSVTDRLGRPFAFDNDLTAPLARYLIAKYPRLAGRIETRGRAYDGIDVLAEVRRAQE